MIPSGLILGYHGCEASLARSVVLGEQTLEASTNGHDWLGEGIYFWAHDPLRAWEWATASPYRRLSSPAILGAVIDLGNCLNLAERASVAWVAKAHTFLQSSLEREDQASLMPRNKGKRRDLDNRVMESLHTLRKAEGLAPYDTVIGYFAEGLPIYEGAELRLQNHLQICVRNPSQVLGYFFPPRPTPGLAG